MIAPQARIVQVIAHITRVNCLAAMIAGNYGVKIMPANLVLEDQGWRKTQPAIAPAQHLDEGGVKITTHGGQAIFKPFGRFLVTLAAQDVLIDKSVQPVCQDIGRYAKARAEPVKPADTEEQFAQDEKCPAICQNAQCPRDRGGTPALEGIDPACPAALPFNRRDRPACPRSIAIRHMQGINRFAAMRTDRFRAALMAAFGVYQLERWQLTAREMIIAKAQHRQHDQIKLDTAFG